MFGIYFKILGGFKPHEPPVTEKLNSINKNAFNYLYIIIEKLNSINKNAFDYLYIIIEKLNSINNCV